VTTYKVIKSRRSEVEEPIKVQAGEVIKLIEESDANSDWAGWTLCDNTKVQGWIPTQIIDVLGELGIVKENYHAIEFDIIEGEILKGDMELNGWVWARKEDTNIESWAPLNHLKRID